MSSSLFTEVYGVNPLALTPAKLYIIPWLQVFVLVFPFQEQFHTCLYWNLRQKCIPWYVRIIPTPFAAVFLSPFKMKKYAHIEVHSPIVMEVARGYFAIMYYAGRVFQRTCIYYDMFIYMLWSYYMVIYQILLKRAFIRT